MPRMNEPSLNILHITPYYAPAYAFGGVVRAVESLAVAQIKRGHTVTVLTTDSLDHQGRYSGSRDEMRAGVRVVRLVNLSHLLHARLNFALPRNLKSTADTLIQAADVVHVHEFRTPLTVATAPLAHAANKPVVLSPHGTLTRATGRSWLKIAWDRIMSPRTAAYINHIAALTQTEADDIRELWHKFGYDAPVTVIPNGIDPAPFEHMPDAANFRQKYGLGDSVIVLFMGRLHARKGVDVLLRAFHNCEASGAKLVIAGPDEGMLAQLQAAAGNDVIFTGYLDSAARLQALATADIFALPATGEGLSMAVLEALAAGVPVILSPGCNMPEAETSGAGVIVEAATAPLTDALTSLIHDPTRRQNMSHAARQLIREQFSVANVADQYDAVYRQLL